MRIFIAFCLTLFLSASAVGSTTNTFDVLIATGNLTVVGTTTLQGSAFSIAGATFAVVDGNVGIGSTAPIGQFYVHGTSFPSSWGGNRWADLVWISSMGALRGGEPLNGSWFTDEFGEFSSAFGGQHIAIGRNSTISGGRSNAIYSLDSGFIGGGSANTIYAGNLTTISGGSGNAVYGSFSTIAGGLLNVVTAHDSAIGGGRLNYITANYSVIPGGVSNTATAEYTFAGGYRSSATHRGSFIWTDYEPLPGNPFSTGAENEFRVRAEGGFAFFSTSTLPTRIFSNNSIMLSTAPLAATSVPNIFISSINGNVGIGTALPQANLQVNNDVRAASATLTAVGSSIYSITSSSSLHVLSGKIKLEPGAYVEWGDGSISNSSATSGGGGSGNGPTWTKYTKTYADFAAAATSSTSSLVTVAAGTVVHGVKIKHSISFSGGSISAYTISVGTGSGGTAASIYASPYDVFQAAASTALQLSQNFSAETDSSWSIGAAATSTGGNLNTASQGSVDIWILTSTTP